MKPTKEQIQAAALFAYGAEKAKGSNMRDPEVLSRATAAAIELARELARQGDSS